MEELTEIKVSSYPLREGLIHTEILRQNGKKDGNQSFQLSIEKRNNSHRDRSSKWKN
jgi:hypothetical protein